MPITSNWGWPQWAMIILTLLSLIQSIRLHNREITNSAKSAFASLSVMSLILYGGGFFARIDWPQIVWIALMILATGASMITGGVTHKEDARIALAARLLLLVILSAGGFF